MHEYWDCVPSLVTVSNYLLNFEEEKMSNYSLLSHVFASEVLRKVIENTKSVVKCVIPAISVKRISFLS